MGKQGYYPTFLRGLGEEPALKLWMSAYKAFRSFSTKRHDDWATVSLA